MHSIIKVGIPILSAIIVGIFSGCGTTYIKPEKAQDFNDKNIIITLPDSTNIFFARKHYYFGENSNGKYIKGMGRVLASTDTAGVKPQDTTVYFHDLLSIQLADENETINATLNVLSIGVGLALGGLLMLVLIMSSYRGH